MEVTVVVAVRMSGAVEEGRGVLGEQGAAEPVPLDIGHVADQSEQVQVARRAGRQPRLLVGHALGLTGEHRPLVVEEREQGCALVLGGRLLLRQRRRRLGHRTDYVTPNTTRKVTGPDDCRRRCRYGA